MSVRNGAAMVLAWLLVVVGMTFGSAVTENVPAAQAAPTLPAGFTRTFYKTQMINYQLAGMAFIPGQDRMFLTGKCGSMRRLDVDGALLVMPTIPGVNCQTDRGLLGLDPAPDYATSGRVYTLYNYNGAKPNGDPAVMARVSRWSVDDIANPTKLQNEVVLINDLPAYSTTGATCDDSHTVGTVVAAPSGDLYVGNGDASSYCQADDSSFGAQDLNSPRGKIFHIDGDTGAGLSTNPWYDSTAPSSWKSRTFAMGLRNPFRIGLRPGTSTLYLGDVGWNTYEEINVAKGGENFGWPCYEGPLSFRNGYANKSACVSQYQTPPTNLKAPLWSWNHNNASAAAVGGDFYTATGTGAYPSAYAGAYFFGDYSAGKIWTLRTDANDALIRAPEAAGFGSEIGAPVEFAAAPNGDIFYADIATSQVVRIRYAPGNRAPVAVATANWTAGPAPLTVQFDGDDSYDLDNEPITYAWNFGDGSTSTVANPSHTYQTTGTFTARLTVTDALGASSSATIPITTANSPPTLDVTLPPAGTKFAVGDEVVLPVVATDAEDGVLPASEVTYEQRIRHCPFGDCHEHPSGTAPGEEGTSFSCVIPDHGDDAFLEIIISVTDSGGLTTSKTVNLDSDTHDLSVASSPAGVPITVNQTDSNTHPTVKAITGSQNRVVAPASSGGKVFVSWSDGGDADHSFTMPSRDVSLVATYTTPPVAMASATPATGNAPLTTKLSAAGSTDADGDPLTYAWTFGDGGTGAGRDVSHTYDAVGTYTARVTVTDSHGIARSATTTVVVGNTPLCQGELSTITGGDGADRLVGTAGRDVIWAGGGNDSIAGLGGDDLICAGAGTDTLDYSAAPAAVGVFLHVTDKFATGGAGNDHVESVENVTGSAYNDWIIAKDGPSTVAGGGGNDTISGMGGGDRLDGGAGADTVDYSPMTVGVRVLLSLSPARARPGTGAADVLTTFENITGSPLVDSLVGNDVTNRIAGSGGNDSLAGNGGNDALDGGAGTDRADGGAGNDICTTVETRTSCER